MDPEALTRAKKCGLTGTSDILLVFYLADANACQGSAARLLGAGGSRVSAADPYWRDIGAITVEDPDGWRVVLVPTVAL